MDNNSSKHNHKTPSTRRGDKNHRGYNKHAAQYQRRYSHMLTDYVTAKRDDKTIGRTNK